MKLLHFADLHLDAQFAWAPARVAERRRNALRDTLDGIFELAAAEKVDAVLCGGDLYEQERFSPDTAEYLRKRFSEARPLPIFIAPGNHDWFGPKSLYHITEWPENVHIFQESALTPIELADGLTLWGGAHRAPANTDNFLKDFRVDRGGVNIALFHGSERGSYAFQDQGKAPYAEFGAAEIPAAGLSFLFTGHYHTPADAEYHTYPGNPDPLTFGETGDRGVVIAEITSGGGGALSRRVVRKSEVHDIEVDISDCASFQDVRRETAIRLDGLEGVARVTLVGELQPDVELSTPALADLPTKLDAIIPRVGRLVPGYDFEALKQEQTVMGRFVQDVFDEPMDEELRQRVLVTGLRALAGRKDLEVQ